MVTWSLPSLSKGGLLPCLNTLQKTFPVMLTTLIA